MPPRTPQWTIALAAAVTLSLTACEGVSIDTGNPSGGGNATSSDGGASAASRLDGLSVAKASSMRGYSREKFDHWRSAGKNCDVRDTVLKRDGANVKFSGCNVVAGSWKSIYDGQTLNDPGKVDIDHMVPLANAWRSGAAEWTDDERSDFANDLDRPQLFAVSASSNRSKGDQDPSTWKPTDQGAWCEYAEDWIAVKSHWKLTVTTAEKSALTDMLERC